MTTPNTTLATTQDVRCALTDALGWLAEDRPQAALDSVGFAADLLAEVIAANG